MPAAEVELVAALPEQALAVGASVVADLRDRGTGQFQARPGQRHGEAVLPGRRQHAGSLGVDREPAGVPKGGDGSFGDSTLQQEIGLGDAVSIESIE